jgi:hypothetical protein
VNHPERCAGPDDPAGVASRASEAAEIQALLRSLSQVRLAVSADLSAAAGALEDDRPDIAADVLSGARGELAELRARVRRREHLPSPFPQKVAVSVGGSGTAAPAGDVELRVPDQEVRRPRHLLARALAGAGALAIAIAVIPQITRSSSHPSNGTAGATAVQQSPDIRLASSEFTLLSQRLLAADASPATIVTAERSWQGAVASSLPAASANTATASAVVTMLQQERTLLAASPALRAPANQALATALAASSQGLLTRLRELAHPQVLAILPTVLRAVPLRPTSASAAPTPGATRTPGVPVTPTGPTSGTGTGAVPTPAVPSAGATDPSVPPSAPAPSGGPVQLPVPDPTQLLPVPLPSTLGQLPGGDDTGLDQTVGSLLNGLGLAG